MIHFLILSLKIYLQNKLVDFTDSYKNHRVHSSLSVTVPAHFSVAILQSVVSIEKFNCKPLCLSLAHLQSSV